MTGRLKLAVGVALRPPTVDLHTHTRQRRSGKFPNSECTLPPLKQWGEGFLLNLQIDSRAAMLLEYPGPRANPQGGAVDKILEEQRACCAGARVGRPFNIIKKPVGREAWTQPCCNLHDFQERFPLVWK